jgi:hypothetical protein
MPDKINLDSTSLNKINSSLILACLVLFNSICAISAELKCGVHPHQVLATSLSNSERVRGNTSTQPCELQQDKNSEQERSNTSTQPNSNRNATPSNLANNSMSSFKFIVKSASEGATIFKLIDVSIFNFQLIFDCCIHPLFKF